MKYDVVIENGLIMDPAGVIPASGKIFIKSGKFVHHDAYSKAEAERTIDAQGCIVTPGLIDSHAHVNQYGGNLGGNADMICLPNACTTVIDSGSTGCNNFELFYISNIVRSTANVKALLHAYSNGVIWGSLHEENADPAEFDAERICELFDKYPSCLRGLKIRQHKHSAGPYGVEPLRRTVEIAEELKKRGHSCVVAVHFSDLADNVEVADILEQLRPGDVFAHMFQFAGKTIFDKENRVLDCVRQAQKRGVLLDSCNGRFHFSIETLTNGLGQGLYPDIISTDIGGMSSYVRPAFSLLHSMSMMHAFGMPIDKIIKAVTSTPAAVYGLQDEAGTFEPGSPADVSIFKLEKRDMEYRDRIGQTKQCGEVFVPMLTLKNGRVAYRQIYF